MKRPVLVSVSIRVYYKIFYGFGHGTAIEYVVFNSIPTIALLNRIWSQILRYQLCKLEILN